jgi:hypothetical protein
MMRKLITIAAVAALLPGVAAGALYDVLVGTSAGPVPGSRLTIGFFAHGGAPIGGGFSTDVITGYKLFPADFGDFAGGPRATDDPGFQAFAGTFGAGELVSARGLGGLQYWAPGTAQWSAPPAGEAVRLFGAVPTDIAVAHIFCQTGDPFLCDPGLAALYPFYAQGTAFSAAGVTGPNPTIIDAASGAGSFHAHLDWFIEQPGGSPSTGAYLLNLQLTAAPKYLDSEPFSIIFNYGLTPAQFQTALLSRTELPVVVPEIPEPASAATLLAGLALLAVVARLRSSRRARA